MHAPNSRSGIATNTYLENVPMAKTFDIVPCRNWLYQGWGFGDDKNIGTFPDIVTREGVIIAWGCWGGATSLVFSHFPYHKKII